MTQKEIKQTARLMEEGKLDLKEWLERRIDEDFRKLGLRPMTDEEWKDYNAKRGQGIVTGTITFLKGESARKAKSFF